MGDKNRLFTSFGAIWSVALNLYLTCELSAYNKIIERIQRENYAHGKVKTIWKVAATFQKADDGKKKDCEKEVQEEVYVSKNTSEDSNKKACEKRKNILKRQKCTNCGDFGAKKKGGGFSSQCVQKKGRNKKKLKRCTACRKKKNRLNKKNTHVTNMCELCTSSNNYDPPFIIFPV